MLQYSACKNIRRTSLKPAQQVHRPEWYNWNKQEIKNYRRNKNYTQLRALILCTWHTPTRRDVSERHVGYRRCEVTQILDSMPCCGNSFRFQESLKKKAQWIRAWRNVMNKEKVSDVQNEFPPFALKEWSKIKRLFFRSNNQKNKGSFNTSTS